MAETQVPIIQFTSAGFIAPSGPAVLAGVQLDIDGSFGGTLNYGLTTPQGQLASGWAASMSNAYAVFVYLSQQTDPAHASGRFQDAIGRIYFLNRNPAQPTSLQLACIGAINVQIPIGALVQDKSSGNLFQCIQAGTIPSGGSITLAFAAVAPGPLPVPQQVTLYQNISGWDSATVVTGAIGRNVESRSAFETRRQETVAGNSFGAIGSIIGAVAKVPGVLDYFGYNNNTGGNVTIGNVDIPAYSIYIAVAGGAPSAVAQAILSKKGAGAPMVGNTTVTTYDSNPLFASPIPYQITYDIPASLQVLFKVIITSGPLVPSSAATQVQSALIAAFAGSTLEASFTGSIAGSILTVSALSSGALSVGQELSDLTGALIAGTTITGLGTGAGGVGTYSVSNNQTVASEAMTSEAPVTGITVPRGRINSTLYAIQYIPAIAALGSWAQVAQIEIGSANEADAVVVGYIVENTLTVISVTSGAIVVGDALFDVGGLIINATYVTAFGSGSGGDGTYTINNPQNFGATFTASGSGTNLTVSVVATGSIAPGDVISGSGVPGGTTIISQTSGPAGGAGVYVTSGATTASSAALTASSTITLASADQSLVTVNANQIPQLVSANILVATT